MSEIPQAASAAHVKLAAIAAVEAIPCTCGKGHGAHPAWCAKNLPAKVIDATLEAAAPHLRAAQREADAQLAESVGAIYPLPPLAPSVTIDGDPVPTTAGNVVVWPDGMPAIGLVSCLLRNPPEGAPDDTPSA